MTPLHIEDLEKAKQVAIKLAKFFLRPKDYEDIAPKILASKTMEELGELCFPGAFKEHCTQGNVEE